ncbi:MAG TPA: response regulator transcription factor [Candidatus Binatia bacterium]|nr:response regulator transcription factor [Candidatus Binatia bacterium]
MPIRVMIVDDHLLVRRGVSSLLSMCDDVEIVAEAEHAVGLLSKVQAAQPDVVLMDIRMPGIEGIQATRQLLKAVPGLRVVILTTYDDDEHIFGALRAGAHAILLKNSSYDQLVDTVRTVAQGKSYLAPELVDRVRTQFAALSKIAVRAELGITELELEIIGLMAEGASNREIADALHWSESTVKRKIENVFGKLQVTNRIQAVAEAIRLGLI